MWTQKQLYYNVILPYSQVLEDLEYYGMRIDEKELYKLKEEFEDRKRDLENDIYKDTGVINLRSSEQKAEAIFGRLGIPKFVTDYEKDFKGNWSETKDYLLTDGGMKEVQKGSNPENLDYKFFSLDIVNCQKLRETTGHPVFQKLIDLAEVNKLLSSYIYSLIKGNSKGEQIMFDNHVHPSYFPFTKGGRLSCISKGTMIEVVRDVSKFPKGIPIEDVKEGDYVYCFDDNLKPTIRKVTWTGKTGRKKVIRLHWNATGNHRKGYLDLTPDHLVRLVDGSYARADELHKDFRQEKNRSKFSQKTSVLALSRTNFHLSFTGIVGYKGKGLFDHRLVYEQLKGEIPKGYHVHHKDHNHLNNIPDNLELLSSSAHASYHSTESAKTPKRKKQLSDQAKEYWRTGKFKVKKGEECPQYLNLSKFTCLKLLAKSKGRIKNGSISAETLIKYCKINNIDHKIIFYRYTYSRKYISITKLKRMIAQQKTYPEIEQVFKCGHHRITRLLELYGIERKRLWGNQWGGFTPHNHYITKIEYLDKEEDVYDIEVENCHNFFANEICVHNCQRPNTLQIPSRSALGKKVKKIFVPDSDEYTLVRMDYSAIELRFLAWLAKERVMMKAFLEDVDLHALTTAHIPAFKLTYEEAKLEINKLQRFYGKTTNFTLVFLGTYFSLQETFLKKGIYLNKKTCYEFEKSYFSLYPDIKPYWNRIKNSLISYGYVENLWGRRRYFPGLKGLAETKETKQIIHNALKSSVSHIVSGSSTGDYVPLKALESIELMKKKKYDGRFWCVIHDAFMYQIKKDQREEFTADMETCLQTPTHPVTIAHPIETRHNTSWYGL